MPAPALMSARLTAAVSLGLLLVVLALSLFVYSPWHRHNRLSGQACAFSSFEHAAGLEAGAEDPLPPPVMLARLDPCPPSDRFTWASRTAHAGRGPPA